MKYPVYSHTTPDSIPKDADAIQLIRPIKTKTLRLIIARLNLREIFLPDSCLKRLSEKARKMLKEHGIKLTLLKRQGRAIGIDLSKLRQIIELYRDDKPFREIEHLTGVPKSTVHYLVKYAIRNKIKLNNKVVYLE